MLWYFDEPLGDSGILPNYMLNQLVSKEGIKVVLSGAGGDELFGGYGYYFQNPKERFINSVPVISKAAGKLLEGRRPDISGRIKRALAYKKAPFLQKLRQYIMVNIIIVINALAKPVKSSLQFMNINSFHIFMICFRRVLFFHMQVKLIKII